MFIRFFRLKDEGVLNLAVSCCSDATKGLSS